MPGRLAVAAVIVAAFIGGPWAMAALAQPQGGTPPATSRSVTGPCAGVLQWLRQEGEDGWVRRCEAATGDRGMTYGGATHSCRDWIAVCRSNPGYSGGAVKSR
jgi:hypothetical protein